MDAVSINPILNPDSTATAVLTITNTGGEDLAYSLTATPLGKQDPARKIVQNAIRPDVPSRGAMAKGEKDRVPLSGGDFSSMAGARRFVE